MDQEQTQASQPSPDTGELGSLEAAALALTKRAQERAEQTAPQQEADATAEADEADPDTEAAEGQPDEDTEPKSELVEAEYEGKTYQVPPELQKALLRQSDYSRKMQEVSETKKTVTQRLEQAETLIQGAAKYAEAMAEVRVIDERMKQFEKLDWARLRSEQPAEYAAYAADFQSLRLSKADAERRVQAVSQEVEGTKAKDIEAKRAEMFKALEKGIKGWGEAKGAEITRYATSNGVAFETLAAITDPGLVIALEKAMRLDALHAAKGEVQAKAKTAPPVMKPGAPRPVNKQAETMARLMKSRSDEDAIAALGARSNMR